MGIVVPYGLVLRDEDTLACGCICGDDPIKGIARPFETQRHPDHFVERALAHFKLDSVAEIAGDGVGTDRELPISFRYWISSKTIGEMSRLLAWSMSRRVRFPNFWAPNA